MKSNTIKALLTFLLVTFIIIQNVSAIAGSNNLWILFEKETPADDRKDSIQIFSDYWDGNFSFKFEDREHSFKMIDVDSFILNTYEIGEEIQDIKLKEQLKVKTEIDTSSPTEDITTLTIEVLHPYSEFGHGADGDDLRIVVSMGFNENIEPPKRYKLYTVEYPSTGIYQNNLLQPCNQHITEFCKGNPKITEKNFEAYYLGQHVDEDSKYILKIHTEKNSKFHITTSLNTDIMWVNQPADMIELGENTIFGDFSDFVFVDTPFGEMAIELEGTRPNDDIIVQQSFREIVKIVVDNEKTIIPKKPPFLYLIGIILVVLAVIYLLNERR